MLVGIEEACIDGGLGELLLEVLLATTTVILRMSSTLKVLMGIQSTVPSVSRDGVGLI
jgi:hypothetical protein